MRLLTGRVLELVVAMALLHCAIADLGECFDGEVAPLERRWDAERMLLSCPNLAGRDEAEVRWWRWRGSDCQAFEEVRGCGGRRNCNVAAVYGEEAFDFCCSLGGNASSREFAKCFSIKTCPHVNSATIPPTLFSGSLATLFLNITLHPLSSLLFPRFLLYHQESSRTVLRWEKKISKSFPYSIVAFIFTVPERGKVVFQPDQLSMSRCSAVESDQYVMDIVRDYSSTEYPTPASSSSSSSPSSSSPSPSFSRCSSPSPSPPLTYSTVEEALKGEQRLLVVASIAILVITFLVVLVVAVVVWLHQVQKRNGMKTVPLDSHSSELDSPTGSPTGNKNISMTTSTTSNSSSTTTSSSSLPPNLPEVASKQPPPPSSLSSLLPPLPRSSLTPPSSLLPPSSPSCPSHGPCLLRSCKVHSFSNHSPPSSSSSPLPFSSPSSSSSSHPPMLLSQALAHSQLSVGLSEADKLYDFISDGRKMITTELVPHLHPSRNVGGEAIV